MGAEILPMLPPEGEELPGPRPVPSSTLARALLREAQDKVAADPGAQPAPIFPAGRRDGCCPGVKQAFAKAGAAVKGVQSSADGAVVYPLSSGSPQNRV